MIAGNDGNACIRLQFQMRRWQLAASESKPDGVGYHIHVAEGIEDLHQCLEEHYGKRIVDRL